MLGPGIVRAHELTAATSDRRMLELQLLQVCGERDRLEHKIELRRLELRDLLATAGYRRLSLSVPGAAELADEIKRIEAIWKVENAEVVRLRSQLMELP
jgi:hypothetical protein